MVKRVGKNHSKTVCTVPLHEPQITQSTAPAQLTYRGGALLSNVKVFTIYWGKQWQQTNLKPLITKIDGFFDDILSSALIDQVKEYSTNQYTIGNGEHIGSVTITNPSLPFSILGRTAVKDASIQKMIQQNIQNTILTAPDTNTLYFVFLPPNVTVVLQNEFSCLQFCGYHSTFNNTYYAVVPYPSCKGCLGNMADFDSITVTASHELCETITDPIPGTGWYDDNHGEIGDICAWKTRIIDGYTVQTEWSNKQNTCV